MTKLILALSTILFFATNAQAAESDAISIKCTFTRNIFFETDGGKWASGSNNNESLTLQFQIFQNNLTDVTIYGNKGTNQAIASWNSDGINISEKSQTGNIITYSIMSKVLDDGNNLAFSLRGIIISDNSAIPSILAGTCRCVGASIQQISQALRK